MRLEFTLRDRRGVVDVAVEADDDPDAFGCPPWGRGFPVCTARLSYDGRGYDAMLGWIQLVRSTDNASDGEAFELDPYEPLGQQSHPFCWFGVLPTLFDAPSRRAPADMEWSAHSFLGFVAEPSEARAILGFGWGFAVCDSVMTIAPIVPLAEDQWDLHLPLLRSEHPTWQFAAGFRDR